MLVRLFLVFLILFSCGKSACYAQANEDLPHQELMSLLDSTHQLLKIHDHERAAELLTRFENALALNVSADLEARYHQLKADWFQQRWQFPDSEKEYLLALEMWTALRDTNRLMETYSGLGTTLAEQKRYQEAIGYQNRALDHFRLNDSVKYYEMRSNLAVSYNQAQDFERALEEYQEVKHFFSRKGLHAQLAIVLGNIGELYREGFKNLELATDHFRQAAALNRKTGQKNFLVQNYHNLGLAFLHQDKIDSARKYIFESVSMRKAMETRGGTAIAMHLLGKYYLHVNQPDSALKAFGETLALSEEFGIGPGIFYGSTGVGEANEVLGNYEAAHAAFQRAAETAKAIGSLQFQETAEEVLYKFYKKNNRHYDALRHFEQLQAFRDSIYEYQNSENLARAKVRYETEIAESENQLLKATQEKQELQIARQRWAVFGMAIVLLLVVVATIFLVWSNRQRKLAFRAAVKVRNEVEAQYAKIKIQEQKLNETISIKNRIFSVLGHDLRGPLANISSVLPLLSSGDLSKDEAEFTIRQLQQETDQSLNTLNNILQWSQLQYDELSLRRKYLSVSEYLSEMKETFQVSARHKKVALEFEDLSDGEVYADENQFRSVITNLISNAIKFSPSGEKVTVTVEDKQNGVEIKVADCGLGFAPEVLTALQQKKSSVSHTGTLGEKGTGIGLQLVRDFMVAHDGEFQISTNPNGGAVVTVFFPHATQTEQRPERKKSA